MGSEMTERDLNPGKGPHEDMEEEVAIPCHDSKKLACGEYVRHTQAHRCAARSTQHSHAQCTAHSTCAHGVQCIPSPQPTAHSQI